MPASVAKVAADRCPAMLTAAAILLDWPDRTIGLRFVVGFNLFGVIESPQIFKHVEPAAPCPPDLQDELRERVPKAHAKLHLVLPRTEYAQELLDHTAQEIDQGWAEGLFTKTQLDQAFGEGNWLPMQRFMHVQPSGKLRPIDNGRSCGHNSLSWALETIITNTPDFAAAACKEFASHAGPLPPTACVGSARLRL